MTAIKTLLFLIVAPGTVLVLIPHLLLRSDYRIFTLVLGQLRWIGLAPAITGTAVLLWSFWAFTFIGGGTPAPTDPPRHFVAGGLYRLVRNPMYVGVLLVLLGEVLLFQSSLLLVYSILVFLAFHLFVVFYEEPRLRRQFGETYLRYLSEVPRWWPRAHKASSQDYSSEQDR
jgi:protein-S-isoprenylcysteine O-methyltransferase Ste14